MIIKRGLLQAFDSSTYTASVLLLEATSCALTGIPVTNVLDQASAVVGALCAVLFFDQHNPKDAVVIAIFANGATGFPSPAPGRLTFLTGFRVVNGDTLASGTINTYTLTTLPRAVLGILYKAYFTSPTVGAYLQLAPHGAADLSAYASIGNIPTANGYLNGCGILQLDSAARFDIQANNGACTVTLYVHGYIS